MMIVSHVLTVVTSPGELPKNYEKLHEDDLPDEFYQLISLRESLYAELVVKKKMRKGELTKASIPNFEEILRLSRNKGASKANSRASGETNVTVSMRNSSDSFGIEE